MCFERFTFGEALLYSRKCQYEESEQMVKVLEKKSKRHLEGRAEKTLKESVKLNELPFGTETILLVDDEISLLDVIRLMLERLGYNVETKMDPTEALELFQTKPDHFDIVITDVTMPQMTGIKLSEKLMEIRPDIPIIVCTGHSHLVNEEKTKEVEIAAFIKKPIAFKNLAKTVRKVLDAKPIER